MLDGVAVVAMTMPNEARARLEKFLSQIREMAEREKQELRTAFFIPTISFDLIDYVADGIERYLNGDAPPNGTGKCRTGLPRDCRNLCSLQFDCLRDLAGDLVIHRLILFVCGRETLGQIARLAAFLQGLQQLGWIDGRNARIDTRSAAGNSDYTRKYAAELLTLAPDVILTAGSQSVGPLLQATRTVPIVFVHVPDPVGAGTVASLARPGGNATGFSLFEYATSGKWLELGPRRGNSGQHARCCRDRALRHGIRARGEWRSGLDGEWVGVRSS